MFAQLSSFALAKLAGFARKAFGVEPAQSQTRHCEEQTRHVIARSVSDEAIFFSQEPSLR